jgi:hypothetical protein
VAAKQLPYSHKLAQDWQAALAAKPPVAHLRAAAAMQLAPEQRLASAAVMRPVLGAFQQGELRPFWGQTD